MNTEAQFTQARPQSDNIPTWPAADFSRVPYEVFKEPEIYRLEMERLFRGPVWNYLAMECEIPNWGDFVVNWVGDTQVVVIK